MTSKLEQILDDKIIQFQSGLKIVSALKENINANLSGKIRYGKYKPIIIRDDISFDNSNQTQDSVTIKTDENSKSQNNGNLRLMGLLDGLISIYFLEQTNKKPGINAYGNGVIYGKALGISLIPLISSLKILSKIRINSNNTNEY